MPLWECHSSQSFSELWLNATAHLFPTSACHRSSVWFHLRRKNNKDPIVPNGKSPGGWKQSNPLADGSCVTATVGRLLRFSRIGLLCVEGASHTWAAIKMQIKLWPSTSGILKARILFKTNQQKRLTFEIWLLTLRSSCAAKKKDKYVFKKC